MSIHDYMKVFMDASIFNEPIIHILIEACDNSIDCGLGECCSDDILNYIHDYLHSYCNASGTTLHEYLLGFTDASIVNDSSVQLLIEACNNCFSCGLGECGVDDIIDYMNCVLSDHPTYREQVDRRKRNGKIQVLQEYINDLMEEIKVNQQEIDSLRPKGVL